MNMAGLTPLQMMAIEKMQLPTLETQTTGLKPLQTAKQLRLFLFSHSNSFRCSLDVSLRIPP